MTAHARTPWGALLRGFLAATLIYTLLNVALWMLVLRHGRANGGPREAIALVLLGLEVATFITVTARLALLRVRQPVITAAVVSCAAVLAAGLVRVALAANGMRRFLIWDHDDVVREAAGGQVFVAIACFVPAIVVAGSSWAFFIPRRRRMRAADGVSPDAPGTIQP